MSTGIYDKKGERGARARKVEDVKKVYKVYGVYDLVVRVEAETLGARAPVTPMDNSS